MFWKKKKTNASLENSVLFECVAPEANAVELLGDFTDWQGSPIRLAKNGSGRWSAAVALSPGSYEYRYLVDGQWANDPHAAETSNPFGSKNSVIAVSA